MPTTDPGEPLAATARFLALVEQIRAAVQAALTTDAARARRAKAVHVQPSDDADDADSADTEDAAVPPAQLEQLVSALLGGPDVAWAPMRIVG